MEREDRSFIKKNIVHLRKCLPEEKKHRQKNDKTHLWIGDAPDGILCWYEIDGDCCAGPVSALWPGGPTCTERIAASISFRRDHFNKPLHQTDYVAQNLFFLLIFFFTILFLHKNNQFCHFLMLFYLFLYFLAFFFKLFFFFQFTKHSRTYKKASLCRKECRNYITKI